VGRRSRDYGIPTTHRVTIIFKQGYCERRTRSVLRHVIVWAESEGEKNSTALSLHTGKVWIADLQKFFLFFLFVYFSF
jgi:hypothetical protein